MHETKSRITAKVFENKFRKPTNDYLTVLSTSNSSISPFRLSKSELRVSIRGPMVWTSIFKILKKLKIV